MDASAWLAEHLRSEKDLWIEPDIQALWGNELDVIPDWNDDSDTTASEVVDTLRAAAAAWELEHTGGEAS